MFRAGREADPVTTPGFTLDNDVRAGSPPPGRFFWPMAKGDEGMTTGHRLKTTAAAGVLLWGLAGAAQAQETTISDAISKGRLILEFRGRYESVDQTKTATLKDNAAAFTLRTHLGWETAAWQGFKGLIELSDVAHAGPEDYAVNAPGAATPPLNGADKAKYPLINDPDEVELNRIQLSWTLNKDLSATVGRQRILIDDQRFVGNVGWRQNEQTFDSARVDGGVGPLRATYIYIDRVNRVLGPVSNWNSDSHLFNVSYAAAPQLRLEGFVYALDFGNSPINNSITEGLKASGKFAKGPWSLVYNAAYADQRNYRAEALPSFNLGYYEGDVAATYAIYTAKVGYEVLDGSGTRGFTTPLATTHAFNGWADVWVSPGANKSFVDGIKDLSAAAVVRPKLKLKYLSNPEFTAVYHDFHDERTGATLANEIDLQAAAAVTSKLAVTLKYADFTRSSTVPVGAAAPPASRAKVWFMFEYRL
jgi:hypothetical protein